MEELRILHSHSRHCHALHLHFSFYILFLPSAVPLFREVAHVLSPRIQLQKAWILSLLVTEASLEPDPQSMLSTFWGKMTEPDYF